MTQETDRQKYLEEDEQGWYGAHTCGFEGGVPCPELTALRRLAEAREKLEQYKGWLHRLVSAGLG